MFRAVASDSLPELCCSSCAGEFRSEFTGPDSEAQVVWKDLVFAAPSTRGIPAKPPTPTPCVRVRGAAQSASAHRPMGVWWLR